MRSIIQKDDDGRRRYSSHDISTCLWCRCSLRKRNGKTQKRSIVLTPGPEYDHIAETLNSQIPLNGRICYSCWFRAHRYLQHNDASNATRNIGSQRSPPSYVVEHCLLCNGLLFGNYSWVIPEEDLWINTVSLKIQPREIHDNARLCYNCHANIQKIIENQQNVDVEPEGATEMNTYDDNEEDVSCINCGFKKYTNFLPVLEQGPAIISIFTEWLSPFTLHELDLICKFCLEHVQNKIRQLIKTGEITDESQPLPGSILSQIENRKVCAVCAKSLNRNKRSVYLLCRNGREKDQLVSDFICQAILRPLKINAETLVCFNCWRSAYRKLEQKQSDSRVNRNTQNNGLQELESQNSEPDNDLLFEECIELPNYRRSPDISTQCVFEDCSNQDLHSISDELRVTLIKNHNYLVTAQARVCQEHLLKNNWEKLFKAKNSISTFKADHIEHVLSFVATSKCTDVDFHNIFELNDNIVEYFLGLSKESFSVILKTLPELQGVEDGVFGLMGLLMKYWNGGPISKVAGLLKICPKNLEAAMMQVLEILKYSPVTVNMGIEYLLKTNK